jgi:protein-S-isoprenylcysteine O-methyltransferase Ste14
LVLKFVTTTTLFIALHTLLLFVPAGTVRWAAGWVFLAEVGGFSFALGWWLMRHDPALLADRLAMPVQSGQKTWDKVFILALYALCSGWLVLIALDAARFRWSQVPAVLQAAGAVLIALCMYLVYLAFRENSYAAAVVKIQAARGHRVVSTGAYAYLRHPFYAGILLFFIGTPLLLGSWYGLVASSLLAALLGVRILMEERTLANELPGYRDYAARVRHRLIPGIW